MKAAIDRAGVAELGRSQGVRNALLKPGREVLRLAVTNAPYNKGRYRSSLGIRQSKAGAAVVYVYTNDRKALWLEYGTGDPYPSPYFETLSRAVRRAGFKRVQYVPHVRKGKRGK